MSNYQCSGCDHKCDDPDADLAAIRAKGGISCCPERRMYRRTDDTMNTKQIRDFLDYDADCPIPDLISCCSGEWRKEPDGLSWRAWDVK